MLAEGFESGSFGGWTTKSITLTGSIVHEGAWSARSSGSGGASNAWHALPLTQTEITFSHWFHVISRSTAVWTGSLRRTTGKAILHVGLSGAGKVAIKNVTTGKQVNSGTAVSNGTWHRLDVHAVIAGSAGHVDVALDGVTVPGLDLVQNLGTDPIGRVMIGESANGRTYDVAIDDVVVSTDTGTPDVEDPTVPTGLTASASGASAIDLTWSPSSDDIGVVGYGVYRSLDGLTFSPVGTAITTAFRDTGLQPETTYTYVVDAFDAAGKRSPWSDPASGTTGAPGASPLGVVLIVTDDQPADTIDRMATLQAELVGKGVTFPNGVVSDPLCCPSRASIQRGQYSHTTGVYSNNSPFGGYSSFSGGGLHLSTIATWLDGAGFRTGFIGKYMNGAGASARPPGWDSWRGATSGYFGYKVNEDGTVRSYGSAEADYSTRVFEGYADEFIRSTAADVPFLLEVHPYAPHNPQTVEPRYEGDPRCTGATNATDPAFNEADVSDKPAYIRKKGLVSVASIGNQLREAECRTLLSVDDLVATILDGLADTGRLSNALIVFTSDNGTSDGEHRWVNKLVPYHGAIRVPFVVRYDPLTAGTARTEDRVVANVDLAPTILDLAGVSASPGCASPPYGGLCTPGFDGVSFLGALAGPSAAERPPLLLEHWDGDSSAVPAYCGLLTATHKYVRYTTGEEELYDLVADPHELVNILGDGSITPEDQALRDQYFTQLFGVAGLCRPPPPNYAIPTG